MELNLSSTTDASASARVTGAGWAVRHRVRRRVDLTLRHAVLVLLALLTLFPVLLVISTALKTPSDVTVHPFSLFSSFSTENLVEAWTVGNFSDYLLNSFLLTVPSTALVIVISTLAGYTFARLPFRSRRAGG